MDRDRHWDRENAVSVCVAVAVIFCCAMLCAVLYYMVQRATTPDPTAQQRIELKRQALASCDKEENTQVRALCIAVINEQNNGK